MNLNYLLGIDVGGTFTDVVLGSPSGALLDSAKALTTPNDPVEGCVSGVNAILAATGVAPSSIGRVVHATTLATNLLLEGKGAGVGYVTTAGFGDLPRIGRELRAGSAVFELFYEKPVLPVSHTQTFEIDERVDARGNVLRPVNHNEIRELLDAIGSRMPEAVAICFLNSYANPTHEQQVGRLLRSEFPGLHVAISSEICPVMREYDRAATTITSAYVGPVLDRYILRLEASLAKLGIKPRLEVMVADGGIFEAAQAVRRAVYCLESGPAAGVIAASYIARHFANQNNIISFDMGGTTAKAGLVVDGEPTLANELHVGGTFSSAQRSASTFPLKVPSIDLSEVGSGGGSIAWVDAGGLLRVGPQSAGAVPGPACYGRGGTQPTTTDADVVLGFIDPATSLASGIEISFERAVDAIESGIASRLGIEVAAAAAGIYDIANSMMAGAIRSITVERGIDPRDYIVCGFGGAGPIHVAAVAAEFGIAKVIVPRFAGVMSALGLLASDISQEFIRTHLVDPMAATPEMVESEFIQLKESSQEDITNIETHGPLRLDRAIDARFRHQTHELTIDVGPVTGTNSDLIEPLALIRKFHDAYRRRFGIDRREPVEFVNFRLRATAITPKAMYVTAGMRSRVTGEIGPSIRRVYSPETKSFAPTATYRREFLVTGFRANGPVVIDDRQTSVVVPLGFTVEVDEWLNLVLTKVGPTRVDRDGVVDATNVRSAVEVPSLASLMSVRRAGRQILPTV